MSRLDKNHISGVGCGSRSSRGERRFDIPEAVIRCDLIFPRKRLVGRIIDVSLRGMALYVLGQVPRDEMDHLLLYLDDGRFSCHALLTRKDKPYFTEGWILGFRCYRRLPAALFRQLGIELSPPLTVVPGGRLG